MDTHFDREHRPNADEWMKSLEAKADKVRELAASKITGGGDGEPVLARWKANGVIVTQRPDDEHGILRISIGGGNETPVPLNYLVFRGDQGKCVDLLRRALAAFDEAH